MEVQRKCQQSVEEVQRKFQGSAEEVPRNCQRVPGGWGPRFKALCGDDQEQNVETIHAKKNERGGDIDSRSRTWRLLG